MTAVLAVVLLGMVAFAVDFGYLCLARTEAQTAADAGAMAGALAVPDGPSGARVLAQAAAQANLVAGSPVVVVPQEDVELGVWDDASRQFTLLSGADEARADTVRFTCRRTSSRGNPVSLFFGRVFGKNFSDVSATAIARRRARCGGLIGLESADLNGLGAYTDSYNAALGDYAFQTPGSRGHLCSNGPIDVQNGTVNGNAMPGPGRSVSIGSHGSVTGTTTPRTEMLVMPAVDFSSVASSNDNGLLPQPPYNSTKTAFKHNGGEMSLPAGTYYFTDFSISGDPVTVDGPVIIYVAGDVSTSGQAIVNETHVPANLQIHAAGKYVKISGGSDFVGFIYAPSSDVEVTGSAGFYGGAVGKTLKLHNSAGVHADESLTLLEEFPARPRLVD